jgi:beta-lactamase regulating signal transducer with metallopeptidase domain
MTPALSGPLAQAIGWALLHAIWQCAAIAALLALTLACMSRTNARMRYAASCVALALIVLSGAVTAIRCLPASPATAPAIPVAHPILAAPASDAWSLAATPPAAPAPASGRLAAWMRIAGTSLPEVVLLWLAGVALFSLRLLVDGLRARRLVRRNAWRARAAWRHAAADLGEALGIDRAVRVLETAATEVPSVVGLLRPVILLPVSTLSGLTPRQVEMILAHELAHVRRHDLVVNLLQAIVETLWFYHPAVWWISNRVRIERENCCDDLAVAICGDPLQYARALTRLEELRARPLALAASATGGSLIERIRRLLGASRPQGPAVRGGAALGVISLLLLAVVALPALGSLDAASKLSERTMTRAITRTAVAIAHRAAGGTIATVATSDAANEDQAPPEEDGSAVAPPAPPEDLQQLEVERDVLERERDRLVRAREQFEESQKQAEERAAEAQEAAGEDRAQADADREAADRDEQQAKGKEKEKSKYASIDEAIELQALGVTPAVLAEVRSLFPGAGPRQVGGLIAVGATPGYVQRMRAAGLDVRSIAEAQGLAAVGVDPEWLASMRATGMAIANAREATELRAVGVTPEYVREMRAAGIALDARDATSLQALGVTPEFVRKLANAGFANLGVRDLERLGASGLTGDFVREMSKYRSD